MNIPSPLFSTKTSKDAKNKNPNSAILHGKIAICHFGNRISFKKSFFGPKDCTIATQDPSSKIVKWWTICYLTKKICETLDIRDLLPTPQMNYCEIKFTNFFTRPSHHYAFSALGHSPSELRLDPRSLPTYLQTGRGAGPDHSFFLDPRHLLLKKGAWLPRFPALSKGSNW